MKYINHMTTSAEDDRHSEVMEKAGGGVHGLAAYGLYWIIAEKIAAQIRPEQITTWMTRSWKKWGEMCGIRPTLFQKRVKSMAEVGLIFLYCDEKSACIHLPNLLKYADEYIKRILKNSGQTPEGIGRMSSLPALPAYPAKQDLKPSACGIVDNPPAGDGAGVGGGSLEAPPPPAPTSETAEGPSNFLTGLASPVIPIRKDQKPTPEEIMAQAALIEQRRLRGIPESGRAGS